MPDHTPHAEWVAVLFGNLRAQFHHRPDVLVAARLPWQPAQGQSDRRQVPDVAVVFGRPKGDRVSYNQWEEGGVPPTVIFEVLAPEHDAFAMADKHAFYDEHGVEEYYVIDPASRRLAVYLRHKEALRRASPRWPHFSPRLGVSFTPREGDLVLRDANGKLFLTLDELQAERRMAEAMQRAERAESAAAEAAMRADLWEKRGERLAELSRKLLAQQISPEETEELRQLAGS